ncbi:DUF2752 domain-containing protein [[Clostridium] innocuum]|nr:DUF2752 domain-containing protein [[Clostridium] innocuum]MCR0413795.1 DUF2752 domain-containing protein [[Clostridium] innocuum]MCR0534697.1 DUF2752 domain-containing protein [[Clostridium] innocuum]MCR0538819.1 DUF2752 domain-containing protein [[Clostridium] innocuum]MDU1119280.1 DUF2752 domain-containing protein [Erysipelotrichaceae bacterium]
MSRDVKKALGIGVILFLVLFVFGSFCPMERILGIPCPGCNMFSAIYWLYKGNLSAAWYFHPAVFLLLPYTVMCAVLFVRSREGILKSRVFRVMSVLLLGTMLAVYIWRMLYVFPHAPMQLNEHAPLIRLLELFF